MKRHTVDEITRGLARARELTAKGLAQTAIVKELGISVMTLHRWRRSESAPRSPATTPAQRVISPDPGHEAGLIEENRRLRMIVIDLVLKAEKAKGG